MKHPLTQHRISSTLALAQYLKRGDQTVLDSIEFDLFVNEEGKIVLGHPGEVRRGIAREMSVEEFFALLENLNTKQIVIDVKARLWNAAKEQAEFAEGSIDTLLAQLPSLIEKYVTDRENQSSVPEVVVASVDFDFFRAIQERGTQFPPEVKLRAFTRNKTENQFAEALALGVGQVGLEYPKGAGATERLDQLVEQSKDEGAQKLEVSFYTVDNPEAAEAIRTRFPDAEIITNISSQFEARETRRDTRIDKR